LIFQFFESPILKIAKLPYIESSMSVEDFDNEEIRDKKILEEFEDV